jgi:hypothetical protein
MYKFASVLVATAVWTSAGVAAELKPVEAKSINLNDVTGVAYYTVEADGYAVVATVASGETATPVRFTAKLLPGQRTTVSVPREPGLGALSFEIIRDGDRIEVVEPHKVARLD